MAIPLMDPSEGLFNRVATRLQDEERYLRIRSRFFVFFLLFVLSAVAIPFAVSAFSSSASASGFTTFVSLVTSDTGIVLEHWQEFGYSLLETLPILTLTFILGLSIILLSSLEYIRKEFRNVWKHLQLHNAAHFSL